MREFKPRQSFSIYNSKGLFEKLQEEYLSFDKDHLSSRHAINAAMTSWHLTDWTYEEFYKNDTRFQDKTKEIKGVSQVIKGLKIYQDHISKICPPLSMMKLIANGSKHCVLNDKNIKDETSLVEAEFHPAEFHRHEFFVPHYIVKTSKGDVNFEEALLNTICFWKTFLEEKYTQVLCSNDFLCYLEIFPSTSYFLEAKNV